MTCTGQQNNGVFGNFARSWFRAQPPLMAAVLSAFMVSASMVSAGMSFMVLPVVMVAGRILHICKASVKKLFYRLVAASADSGIEPDSCLFKGCLRASADPAADKHIRAQIF